MSNSPHDPQKEDLSLSKAVEYLLDECRMVLPGIQALFGFQLIAVFNDAFERKLTVTQQSLHLVAVALAMVAIGLIMAPAALHRQTNPRAITSRFIDISSRLLLWSMAPLAISLGLDFYLIARIILDSPVSALLAAVLAALFISLWFVLPRLRGVRSMMGASGKGDCTSGVRLQGEALVDELRRGGYVIFLRHAHTDPDQADTDPFHLDNTKAQRHLTDVGRREARSLGQAFRALGIPIDRVWSGEFCRTRDTAALLEVAEVTTSPDLTEGGHVFSETENRRRAEALRRLLATPPRSGRNTLIVSHNTNLQEAAGKEFGDLGEGESIVFRPGGRKRFQAVARVKSATDWLE
jgi:phosphohistidine phosphatase SixA